jgi:WD40 repeat protein
MFDPYRTWLGILPEYQPPSHYRLLGVSLGESDPKVIDAAARRRIAHLRQFQVGVNANAATKLMNEVARARAILLDPKKRKDYDASLGLAAMSDGEPLGWDALGDADQRVLAQAPKRPAEVIGLAEDAVAPVVRSRRSSAPSVPEASAIPWPVWAMGAGTLFVLGGVVTLFLSGALSPGSERDRVGRGRAPVVDDIVPRNAGNPGGAAEAGGDAGPATQPQPKGGEPPPAAEPKQPDGPILETLRFTGHTGPVNSVVLSSNSAYALSASSDTSIKRWNVSTGRELSSWPIHRGPVRGLSVDGLGAVAVSCADDKLAGLRLWGPSSGQPPPGPGQGRFIGDTTDIRCVAMAHNGLRVLTGGGDGMLRLWNVASGRSMGELLGHTEPIRALAVSADGRIALSAGGDRKDFAIRLWDEQGGGQPLREFTGHQGPVVCLALSADGHRVLSASHDGTVGVWDVGSGKQVQRFTGHRGQVWCVAYCMDGKRAISGGQDGIPRLWDVETGKELRTFQGHSGGVRCLAVSRDANWLVTGGEDRSLRKWAIPPLPLFTGPQIPGFGPPGGVGSPPGVGAPPPPGMTMPQQPPMQPPRQPPQPKGIGPPTPPPGFQVPQPPPKG